MPILKLKSQDGRVFKVDLKAACRSKMIDDMLKHVGVDEEESKEEEVPVTAVRGEILELVLDWAEKHKDDPEDGCIRTEWDKDFIKRFKNKNELLYELTKAVNYLDMKGLLDLACEAVADLLKGKKPEELRKFFGLDSLDD